MAQRMEPTVLTNYHDATRFGTERFSPVSVAETERMKVVLTCFEASQFIPVHAPGVDMALVILEGEARVMAAQEEVDVGPGAIIVVPAGQSRGVRATTRLVAVHVVSPPPTESDHTAVQAGLHQGTWR
jgi:quercetin dioxygenase-like cupin family protein